MRTLIHLIVLIVGFLGGIYVGVHFPQQAQNVEQIRKQEQDKLAPQIEQAVAKAKIDLLNRFLNNSQTASTGTPGSGFAGSSGFVGGGSAPAAGNQRAEFQRELDQEQQNLNKAQSQLNSK